MKRWIVGCVLLLLVGCTSKIRPHEQLWAEDECKGNGGISYIEVHRHSSPQVTCMNGGVFNMKQDDYTKYTDKR